MPSHYEKAQGTQIQISPAPVSSLPEDMAGYLDLDCTLKEIQFTAGQKQDIDVTTLSSTEQETVNGLPAASEISLSGNFFLDAGQNALRRAYDTDDTYAFKILFPSGRGVTLLAEVRQHTWSSGANGVVSATFALRLKGKPVSIEEVTDATS